MSRNISTNFTLDEVSHSDYAVLHKIDNTMPDIYFSNAQNLAKYVLEPVRMHFGQPFSPESWFRCERVNSGVGGSKTSDHMIGAAADIVVPKVSLMALAAYIRDNLQFDQIILENSWVHVSFKKDNNRMQVLTKIPGGYRAGLA